MIIYENSAFKFSTLQGCKTIRTLKFRTEVSCLIIIFFQIWKLSLEIISYYSSSLKAILLYFK